MSFACWGARVLLDLYADGRLSPARSAQVEAHLEACGDCARLARPDAALRGLLKSLARPQAPAGLAASILKKHEQGAEAPQAWSAPRLRPAQAAALVYLALLAAGQAVPGPESQSLLPAAPAKEAKP